MDQLGVRLLKLPAHAHRCRLAGVQNHRGDPLRHQTLQGFFRTPRAREAGALVAETWGGGGQRTHPPNSLVGWGVHHASCWIILLIDLRM